MKMKELFIEDYKLLKNFTVNFDSQLTVFIGKMYYLGISTILQDRFIQFQEHFIARSLEGDQQMTHKKLTTGLEGSRMSNRSLVEINHDSTPHTDEELLEWAKSMKAYLSTVANN